MKRLLLVACVVAGVAAGLAVGWLLAPRATTQPPAIEAAEQPAASRPAPLQPASQPATEQHKVAAPDFAALVTKYRPATVMSGGGEFTGRVTLADGRPVGGVEIRCTPYLLPIPDGLTLEAEVEAFARKLALEEAGEKTVRTAGDGSYRVAGLDESARYAVVATSRGHDLRPATQAPATFHTPGRELNFVARAVIWVTADVRMADGSQPEIARMSVRPTANPREFGRTWVWTPTDRKFGLEPGEWSLQAFGGRFGESPSERMLFEVRAEGPPPELKVVLNPMPWLRGRVNVPDWVGKADSRGSSVVAVKLERADGGEVSVKRELTPIYRSNPYPLYLPSAEFSFVELRPGPHRLTILLQGSALGTKDIEIAEGMAWVEMDMPEPDVSAFLVARVNGPDGPVIEGVYLMLETRNGGSRGSGGTGSLNKGNGDYWIPRTAFKGREGTEYTLTAKSQKLGERSIKLEPETAGPVEFTFTEPGFIVVDINGYDDHAQRDELRVSHWPANKEPSRTDVMRRMGMDEEQPGRSRRIGPLEPGEFVVVLSLGEIGFMGRKELDRETVRVSGGEAKVVLVAPALHSLTITIPEEYRATQLVVRFAANHEYSFTSSNGQAEFVVTGLRPGDYHIGGRPFGQMTVTVPAAGDRVEFKPLPFNALIVIDWGRPDAKDIGLKAGDLVILIDGQPLDDKAARDKALRESRKGQTTWTVLRAGQRTNVTFTGSELNQSGLHTEEARWN